eukprot:Hpha_TRINITY_DN16221_c0_g1::TRINITY_DN16221_c0_g1_i1::g.12536::m.12536/K15100/SLC25A1, CTP; solute carrier family 25 (mitochondrial citrate transporter), member 1
MPETRDRVKTLAAMAGGVCEACSLQPLDVMKTRLQLQGKGTTLGGLARTMFREEGALSFYKGLTPFCTHLVLKYAVRWKFNEVYRNMLKGPDGKVSTAGTFLAGLGAGVTEAILIVTPFEVLKTRLQQQKGSGADLKYKGPVHCARTIIREEGATAMWKGNVPCMFRQGWNQLFLFGTYDKLKELVLGLDRDAKISKHQSLSLGIIAGALGPLTNNPFDVAKTRLQGQLEVGDKRKYTNMVQCIGRIYKEEGFSPLMRGCVMRMARVAPGMGITFTVVETATERYTDQQIPFPFDIGVAKA